MALVTKSKRPATQEELDERARAIFDPFALFEACHFADREPLIQTVLETLDSLVWESSTVPPKFEWGRLDAMVEQLQDPYPDTIFAPVCFNCPAFFNMIRPIMRRAHDLCTYFKFVAYAFLEEDLMAAWWYEFITSTPAERMDMMAPIMIIEPSSALFLECGFDKTHLMGMGDRVPMGKIEVEWAPLQSGAEQNRAATSAQQQQQQTLPKGMRVAVYKEHHMQAQYVSRSDSKVYREEALGLRTKAPILGYACQRLGFRGGLDDDGEGGSALGQSRTGMPMILPHSFVYDAMALLGRILEAQVNLNKAEGCNVQPFILYQPNPVQLDFTAIQRTTAPAAAHAAQPRDLAVMERHQNQQLSFQEWWTSVQRINFGLGTVCAYSIMRLTCDLGLNPGGGGQDPANAPSQILRRLYGHSSPVEVQLQTPHGHTLAHVHKPETLQDIPALEEKYRNKILEGCGIGVGVFEHIFGGGSKRSFGASSGGSGSSGASNLFAGIHASGQETPAERQLNHVIHAKREWNTSFFHHLYAHCWFSLDMREIDEQLEYFEQEVASSKQQRRALKGIQEELRMELAALNPGPEKKATRDGSETDTETGGGGGGGADNHEARLRELQTQNKDVARARAKTKKNRRILKAEREHWARLWEEIHTKRDCLAKLVFHPGTTERTAKQLGVLVQQMYPLGLVSEQTLEHYAKPVFGAKFKVERNPQPPLTPAKSLSPGEELQAQTTLKTAQLQSDTTVGTTELQAAQTPPAAASSSKAKAKPAPPAKKKKPPKVGKIKRIAPDSDDSDSDNSSDSDTSAPEPNKKKKKRNEDEDDKNKRAKKRARK